jgi:hypothetical protein
MTQYPHTDEHGVTWVNPSAFVVDKAGPCFFCKKATNIVDVDWGSYYCGNDDEEIRRDLDSLS